MALLLMEEHPGWTLCVNAHTEKRTMTHAAACPVVTRTAVAHIAVAHNMAARTAAVANTVAALKGSPETALVVLVADHPNYPYRRYPVPPT